MVGLFGCIPVNWILYTMYFGNGLYFSELQYKRCIIRFRVINLHIVEFLSKFSTIAHHRLMHPIVKPMFIVAATRL